MATVQEQILKGVIDLTGAVGKLKGQVEESVKESKETHDNLRQHIENQPVMCASQLQDCTQSRLRLHNRIDDERKESLDRDAELHGRMDGITKKVWIMWGASCVLSSFAGALIMYLVQVGESATP